MVRTLSVAGCLWLLYAFSCAVLPLAVEQSSNPRESFVKVITENLDGRLLSMGSGSIIKQTKDGTTILTAGHVCHSEPDIKQFVLDIHAERYSVKVIKTSDDPDLCLLISAKRIDQPALKIAQEMPLPGDRVFNVAAPKGIFDRGMVLKFSGYYSGELLIKHANQTFSIYTVPTAGGSSGSPILNEDREIIGVISRARSDFESLCLAVRLDQIKEFLND